MDELHSGRRAVSAAASVHQALSAVSWAECLGAATGIVGALLLAWRGKWAAWAWVLWVVSAAAWMVFAATIGSVWMLAQQAVFFAINVLGIYRWFRHAGAK